ncbi:replication-relaxation family protein [Plantactinospora solaniradicis]|uniref:Replication-relaxation family protein n=1 Tax=Plantactinospora solaniradicis TaxID=1723736 RepID=A0ABW1KN04_9ACTN
MKPPALPAPLPQDRPEGASATKRISFKQVEWVRARLAERDWQIIHAIDQLRVVTGEHIEKLLFADLASARSRVVSRGRVLRRLVAWHVLIPLDRRIGGPGRGSSKSVFALDSLGQRLLTHRQQAEGQARRVRRPGTPTERSLRHALAVSELYVRLICLGRLQGFMVAEYSVEPRWPDGVGGQLGPDAYVRLELGDVVDHWAIEVDRSTEALETTLRRKLTAYLDFARRGGQLRTHGVMPRVLVSCTKEGRPEAVEALVRRLPSPAHALFAVVQHDEASAFLWTSLQS